MKKICISKDWKFKNVDDATPYVSVDLPHDYQIGAKRAEGLGTMGNGFFPDKVGKYVKHLSLEKGRHYILDIDGAYMCAHVVFNEEFLGMHPNGYTPYLVDLTPHVFGDITNKLIITTHPLYDSTRWYSGNGISRDVFLWEGGDLRIEPWDLFISTDKISGDTATLRIKYTVSADRAADVELRFTAEYKGDVSASAQTKCSVIKGKTDGEFYLDVPSAKLWDTEEPNLYTLRTEVIENGAIADETETVIGIRTVTADVKNGLLLNGKPIKLRGGCIHHDHGDLGAVALPAAEERKIRLLKEAGFNAIRCTHNPSSLALLEACDRLGMIAMDEAFDVWNIPKKNYDYHLFFADWWARDISYMVRRDRNHPCIFSYSIGNEIFEINGTSNSAELARSLSDEIRKYDDTRFVTSGIQKWFTTRTSVDENDPEDYREYFKKRSAEQLKYPAVTNAVTASYEEPLDIVGLNYYYDRYTFDHEMYPNRVMWGSETQALKFYHSWKGVEENSYVLGDFTWTAFDNLGEAGAGRMFWAREMETYDATFDIGLCGYPWRACYQGDYDLCGFRRPQSYFREAIWRKNTEPRIFTTHPEHFGEESGGTGWHWYDVNESWTYDDCYVGRPIKAETYTVADKIEWFVNGEKVGESVPVDAIATIETVYRKGEIRAVAYKDGAPYSEYTLRTVGEPTAVVLTPEKTEIVADRRDLCYVRIQIVDGEGQNVELDGKEIICAVHGGELCAVFSGDPQSVDDVNSNRCHTFKGHAVAIVRAKNPGKVRMTVFADGLSGQTVNVDAIPEA